MEISGNIEAIGLSNVLLLFSSMEKSGLLTLQNQDDTGRFIFRFGILIHGSLSNTTSQLGNILQNRGVVSEDELMLISKEHKTTGKPLGQVCEDLGIASKEEIRYCMQLEAEERLFEVLRWVNGTFSFSEKTVAATDSISISKSSDEFIKQGQARLSSIIELRSMFPHYLFQVIKQEYSLETSVNVNLTALELKILSLVSGSVPLPAILSQSPTDTLGTVRVIRDLMEYGLIDIASTKPALADFKTDEIKQFLALFQCYFELYNMIFSRFRKSFEGGAWKTLAEIYNKIKRLHPGIFTQVLLEAEGILNNSAVLGNVTRLDRDNRKLKCVQALNHYLLEQLLMVKNNLGNKTYKEIYNQCIAYIESIPVENVQLMQMMQRDISSMLMISQAVPSHYERGLQYMVAGDMDSAYECFTKVNRNSDEYTEAQKLIKDLDKQKQEMAPVEYPLVEDVNLVPRLHDDIDMRRIQELPLRPEEAYFLTRIDGTTDIKGLFSISQMSKEETLKLTSKFHALGYITLQTPDTVREVIHSSAETVKLDEIHIPSRKPVPEPPVQPVWESISKPVTRKKKITPDKVKPEPVPETVHTENQKSAPAQKSRKELAREHYQKGMKFFTQRNYQDAINEFERAIENNSTNVVYYNMLNEAKNNLRTEEKSGFYQKGVAAWDKGDTKTALAYLKEAVKLDQKDSLILNKLAEYLCASPDTIGDAEKYIRKAVDLDFANSHNYVLLGRVLKHKEKYRAAKEAFQMALEWDNTNNEAKKELRLF